MSRQVKRCNWPKDDALYIDYHDKEWGVPVYDDAKIFEILLLETFQAGLSWITIYKAPKIFAKSAKFFLNLHKSHSISFGSFYL